jgi:hypothetical protein
MWHHMLPQACSIPRSSHNPSTRYHHVGMDAMHRPVRAWPHTQLTFERAPGLLEALQLLVTQRQIGRARVPIVMMQRVNV